MAYVIGVDPGASGALAVYDTDTRKIATIIDMPSLTVVINKKKRTKIDTVTLYNWFEAQKMMDAQLVMMEAVGGRPQQTASGGFVLGYGCGLLYMACIALKLPIETITPQVWKKTIGVPGKTKTVEQTNAKGKTIKVRVSDPDADGMIILRACELLPDARDLFYGPRGGKMVDRAEAAMLAKYAGDYALRLDRKPVAAVDWQAYIGKVDLGA